LTNIIILGAGISGLSAGIKLLERGCSVIILEQSLEIGGLAKTEVKGDYRLDVGPHFITSQNNAVLREILDLFEPDELTSFSRHAKILFDDRYLDYPLTAKNVLLQMGFRHAFFASMSYLLTAINRVLLARAEVVTFEDWAKKNFGLYLYQLFFKPYTEQFWGISCDRLSVDCIPLVTKMSFLKTLKMLFVSKFEKDSLSIAERETTLPLHYPLKGFGEVARKLATKFELLGGVALRGCDILSLDCNVESQFQVRYRYEGKELSEAASNVVSTIPISSLVGLLRPKVPKIILERAMSLDYLSVIVVYLVIGDRDVFDCSYLYILGKPYNRMSNTRRFCPELCPKDENMLALEITCKYNDDIWSQDDEALSELCIQNLVADKFLERCEVKKFFVVRKRFAYPFYTTEYKESLNEINSFLGEIKNLAATGRTGAFKYMDIDQCIEDSSNLARRLL